VSVTAANIEAGLRNCGRCCPIALALEKIGYPYAEVECFLNLGDGINTYLEFTDEIDRFITDFDLELAPVMPFNFVMDLDKGVIYHE